MTTQPILATLRCRCGQMQANINIPSSSQYATQTNVFCACKDCRSFAQYIQNKRSERTSEVLEKALPAVRTLTVYKSDVQIVQGLDKIVPCKLKKNSPLFRYYASCCFTPLFLQPMLLPDLAVYTALVEPNSAFPSAVEVANTKSLSEQEKASIPSKYIISSGVSMTFLRRSLFRIVYGMYNGKGKPNFLDQVDHTKLEIVEKEANH